MPVDSVEMIRVKGAQDLVNERLYRTRPEALKFTTVVDTPEIVLAKTNSLQMSEVRTILLPSFHCFRLCSDNDSETEGTDCSLQRIIVTGTILSLLICLVKMPGS
jgi:hypothetical protein